MAPSPARGRSRFPNVRRFQRGATPTTPPSAPIPLRVSGAVGRALWKALYPPSAAAPQVAALEINELQQIAILDTGQRYAANAAALHDPRVQRLLLQPIARACMAQFAPPVALMLTPDGGVQACAPAEAYARLLTGEAPLSPYAPQLRVHPAILQIWQAAGMFAAYANSPFGWLGLLALLVMVGVSGVMGWIWLTDVVPRLANAIAMLPMAAEWSPTLRYAISLTISGIEIWGLLFMMSRIPATIGVVTGVLDIAFHAGYGIRQSIAVAQTTGDWALVAFGGLVGVLTALAPEPLLLIMVAATVRLAPLIPWALLQVRFGLAELRAVWDAECRRYAAQEAQRRAQRGTQPVVFVDPQTGVLSTVWMHPADEP